MSRINGEKSRANITRRRRTARREKDRALRAAHMTAGAEKKKESAPAAKAAKAAKAKKAPAAAKEASQAG